MRTAAAVALLWPCTLARAPHAWLSALQCHAAEPALHNGARRADGLAVRGVLRSAVLDDGRLVLMVLVASHARHRQAARAAELDGRHAVVRNGLALSVGHRDLGELSGACR